MLNGAYHHRNGLFFRRQEDGSVVLTKRDGEEGPIVFETKIEASAWCWIVAAVSDNGLSSAQSELAAIVHGYRPP